MSASRVVVDSSGWIEVFTGGAQADDFLALMAADVEWRESGSAEATS